MAVKLNSILAATALFALLAGPAAAQEATYSADDVVKHFVKNADLGADRGLCIIGTAACDEPAPPPAPAAQAFDMRVQFELNSADLTPDAKHKLDAFAEAANRKELRRAKFNVDGHTDGRGGEEMNMTLSERRAQSVVLYLEAKGVAADRLVARGYGKTKPVTDNPLADENRRVEANIAAID